MLAPSASNAPAAQPFALLVHPELVRQAVAGSARLAGLSRKVCRPLDRPQIPVRSQEAPLTA